MHAHAQMNTFIASYTPFMIYQEIIPLFANNTRQGHCQVVIIALYSLIIRVLHPFLPTALYRYGYPSEGVELWCY